MASSMDVPTLPDQVREALRNLNCPVRLFGENLANVRDRLRLEMARRKVYAEHYGVDTELLPEATTSSADAVPSSALAEAVQETQYSRASHALFKAREKIATFSLRKAHARLQKEADLRASYKALSKKRKGEEEADNNKASATATATATIATQAAEETDQSCCQLYQSLQNASLSGSQYGDSRPLSAIAATNVGGSPCVLTASWNATLQWWDGSTPMLTPWGKQTQAHEDRIMGIALHQTAGKKIMAGTASIDLTGKLWTVQEKDDAEDQTMEDVQSSNVKQEKANKDDHEENTKYTFKQVAHLKGHEARLCKVAFHPLGDLVATTSHDYTWRLWDIETCCNKGPDEKSEELLLQDGHAEKVFGIDFHPDGSLCATTDYSGMVHVWDLRTGKTVMQYYGHAGRVLCAKFAPTNGFQMTTAGDDGCLKVWDLRHRRKSKKGAPEPRRTIPAHSKLITQLQYTPDDECLVSSSFDGSIKMWSTRGDWRLLQTLEGHEGKVMGADIVATFDAEKQDSRSASDWGVVSCGFDHTLKLWR